MIPPPFSSAAERAHGPGAPHGPYESHAARLGPYAGRGPRGYHRSDERIREEICDRFTEHGWLDATDIEVSVVDGEAKLLGVVTSRMAKRLAEDVAESVAGVVEVHNQLRIRREPAEVTSARYVENGRRGDDEKAQGHSPSLKS
jgi:hypothetical protein